jgi:hypothetical protein
MIWFSRLVAARSGSAAPSPLDLVCPPGGGLIWLGRVLAIRPLRWEFLSGAVPHLMSAHYVEIVAWSTYGNDRPRRVPLFIDPSNQLRFFVMFNLFVHHVFTLQDTFIDFI